MENKKKYLKNDPLGGFEFVTEEDHKAFYYMLNKVVNSQDEMRDLIYYLKRSEYCKEKFESEELKPCLEKADSLIEKLEYFINDITDAFKKKELLIKEKK